MKFSDEIMSLNTPIYSIAKELNIDSDKVLLACKALGINAKGATKRLNEEDLARVKLKQRLNQKKFKLNQNKVISPID